VHEDVVASARSLRAHRELETVGDQDSSFAQGDCPDRDHLVARRVEPRGLDVEHDPSCWGGALLLADPPASPPP
jgi:hypothetical protein